MSDARRAKMVRDALEALARDETSHDVAEAISLVAVYASDATLAKLGRLIR